MEEVSRKKRKPATRKGHCKCCLSQHKSNYSPSPAVASSHLMAGTSAPLEHPMEELSNYGDVFDRLRTMLPALAETPLAAINQIAEEAIKEITMLRSQKE